VWARRIRADPGGAGRRGKLVWDRRCLVARSLFPPFPLISPRRQQLLLDVPHHRSNFQSFSFIYNLNRVGQTNPPAWTQCNLGIFYNKYAVIIRTEFDSHTCQCVLHSPEIFFLMPSSPKKTPSKRAAAAPAEGTPSTKKAKPTPKVRLNLLIYFRCDFLSMSAFCVYPYILSYSHHYLTIHQISHPQANHPTPLPSFSSLRKHRGGCRLGLGWERCQSAGEVVGGPPSDHPPPCGRNAQKGVSGPTHPPLSGTGGGGGCHPPFQCPVKDTLPPSSWAISTAMPPKSSFHREDM